MRQNNVNGKQPLVSIVTPSYNQGKFIEDTILSIRNQNYPNIEHIIVDGKSTDDTLKILKKYEGAYNMRCISEPDNGQADAINKGFAMVKGEIVGWLNSDDVYYDKETISYIVKVFQGRKDIHILYGDSLLISKDNLILKLECKPSFNYKRLLRGFYLTQPSIFFRKTVIEKYKLDTNLNFAMDYEYCLRVGKTHPFYHVNRILSGDRNHQTRKIIAQRDLMKKESIRIRKMYGQKFDFAYYVGRMEDKIISGMCRLRGLKEVIKLKSKETLAFEARMDGFLAVSYRQLFKKNKDLAG
jgi:glycosyltransferase involved in cell wall biosynthesis